MLGGGGGGREKNNTSNISCSRFYGIVLLDVSNISALIFIFLLSFHV